jgi:phage terminase large subunit-like protein
MWRLTSGCSIFGEAGDVLHVARDVGAAANVQRVHRLHAEQHPDDFRVRSAQGRLEIEHRATGGRWLIRSTDGVYSYSAGMAIADESWDLKSAIVDTGLHPVLLQRRSAQLWSVSTAHSSPTGFMLGLRAQALAELDAPESLLWIEWSAHPDDAIADPATWRSACPRWTDEIAKRYEDLHASAMARRPADVLDDDPLVGFTTQYLNIWPSTVEPARRGEPLVDAEVWDKSYEDHTPGSVPLVIGLEEHWDRGVALVLVAEIPGERYFIEPRLYDTRAEAFAVAKHFVLLRRQSRVVCGASLLAEPAAVELEAIGAGAKEMSKALPMFRELLAADRLRHFNSQPITDQLLGARLSVSASGQPTLQVDRGARIDALKATLWAVYVMASEPPLQVQVW